MPLHPEAVPEFHFIPPCSALSAKAVPAGGGWVHEVKCDGYRARLHKVASRVIVFKCQGARLRGRVPFHRPTAARAARQSRLTR